MGGCKGSCRELLIHVCSFILQASATEMLFPSQDCINTIAVKDSMFKLMKLWAGGASMSEITVYFLHVVFCKIISVARMIFLFNFAFLESYDCFQANWHFQSYLAFVHSIVPQFAF